MKLILKVRNSQRQKYRSTVEHNDLSRAFFPVAVVVVVIVYSFRVFFFSCGFFALTCSQSFRYQQATNSNETTPWFALLTVNRLFFSCFFFLFCLLWLASVYRCDAVTCTNRMTHWIPLDREENQYKSGDVCNANTALQLLVCCEPPARKRKNEEKKTNCIKNSATYPKCIES